MRFAGTLGSLGATSAEIYAQVIASGGTPAEAEAASRSGSMTTYTSTPAAKVPVNAPVYQVNNTPDPSSAAFYACYAAPKPVVQVSTTNAGSYVGLKSTPLKFLGQATWTTPVLQPHFTTALDWCLPKGQSGVLNRGLPQSLYDPEEYLRSALIDSDWDRVYNFFLFCYSTTYKVNANDKNNFFPYANINICQYKYTMDANNNKVYWPFSPYDIAQFLMRIVANFTVADVSHSSDHCAIGLINWGGKLGPPKVVDLRTLTTAELWWQALKTGLNTPNQGSSSVFQYESIDTWYTNAISNERGQLLNDGWNLNPIIKPKNSTSPCGNIRVGWVQGPKGDWTATQIVATLVIIAATYGIGIEFGAASATTGAAAGASTGISNAAPVAIAGAGLAPGALSAVSGALAESLLPTIEVTGTAIAAGSVAAGLATGAIIAASAPALMTSSTPSLSTPVINAPAASLDTVTVTGTAATPSTVGAAISSGVLATSTALPVLTTPAGSTVNSSPPSKPASNASGASAAPAPASTETLDTITVTGTAPASIPSTVGAALSSGALTTVTTLPVTSTPAPSTPGTSPAANTSSGNASSDPDAPHPGESMQSWLQRMVTKYGLKWVESNLGALLSKYFGVSGPAQLAAAQADLSAMTPQAADYTPWVLGTALVVGALAVSRKR